MFVKTNTYESLAHQLSFVRSFNTLQLVEYTLMSPGPYQLNVWFEGHPIYGSPWFPTIEPGKTSARQCKVEGDGIRFCHTKGVNVITITVRTSTLFLFTGGGAQLRKCGARPSIYLFAYLAMLFTPLLSPKFVFKLTETLRTQLRNLVGTRSFWLPTRGGRRRLSGEDCGPS